MRKMTWLAMIMAGLFMLGGCSSKESDLTEGVSMNEEEIENPVQSEDDVSSLDNYSITLNEAMNNKGYMSYDYDQGGVGLIYNDKIYLPGFIAELPDTQIKQLVPGNVSSGIWTELLDVKGKLWSSGGPTSEISFYDRNKDIDYDGEIEKIFRSGGMHKDEGFYFIFLKEGNCLISSEADGVIKEFDASDIEMAKLLYYSSGSSEMGMPIVVLKKEGTVEFQYTDFTYVDDEGPFFQSGDLDVSDWSDIKYIERVYIENDADYLVGLKSDGTLMVTGKGYPNEILEWKNLVDVQCTGGDVVALQSDGRLLCSDSLGELAGIVEGWSNIKMMLFWDKESIGAVSENGIYYNVGMPLNTVKVMEYNGNGYDVVRIDEDTEEKWEDGYPGCGYEVSFSLNDY